jgi:hypothetical protein
VGPEKKGAIDAVPPHVVSDVHLIVHKVGIAANVTAKPATFTGCRFTVILGQGPMGSPVVELNLRYGYPEVWAPGAPGDCGATAAGSDPDLGSATAQPASATERDEREAPRGATR